MRPRYWEGMVALFAVAYSVCFTVLAFNRHDSFHTWALDMGNMDQAVWNTIHGRILAFTNMEGVTTRLAIHFEPTLIVVAPIYLIWPDPKALLLLQTIALASGALPIYWIAKRDLKSGAAATAVAAAYLLFPSLEAVNYAEFHAVALAAPLLLWAFHFAETGSWWRFAAAALLAAGTKEEVGLVVALISIYIAVVTKSRFPLLVAGVGVISSLAAVLVVIPAFNPSRASPYAGYYSYLGTNIPAIAINLLLHPWLPIQRSLEEPAYLRSLFQPFGYLPFLAPERLLMGASSFLINILSADGEMQRPNLYHYTAPLIPAIVLATIRGAGRAVRLIARLGIPSRWALMLVMGLLLASAGWYHRQEGLTPLSERFRLYAITPHDQVAYDFFQMVPTGASLSVHPDLNAHLSQREKLYVFPRVADAEYVLMDRLRDASSRDVLTVPTDVHRERLKALDELISSGGWEVLADRDGYVLLKRKPSRADGAGQ